MAASEFTQLELRSAYGLVYRKVSTAPPRDCRPDEIPVIDIGTIYDGPAARAELAKHIRAAAEGTGFFYIKNHGIDEDIINNARRAAMNFFKQPHEEKLKVAKFKSKHYNGYSFPGLSHVSPSESKDNKQGFMWQYDPKYDPDKKDLSTIPDDVKAWLRGEDMVWEGTAHIPDFQKDTLIYWRCCLTLARTLAKVFAVCLDLPEDYFDPLTTYPGADGVYNFYSALASEEMAKASIYDVGLGSHTDLQCFTLLWQDEVGGLQVLSDTQWIKAVPIPGTFVVNIGDFLMRMSNDKFKSTVHRVYNRSTVDRLSMPFFFGFNFNETCSVLHTCTDENNPPKYEPISCGEMVLRAYNSGVDAVSRPVQ
ncbi:uncharacterized protein Z518_09215 [Rhinocladiella mackenziei CBS 650.93]|uniref:Rhinocladiella mackenziei CBS 650.93 unplaced genomic scaffold supercont1.7, whole genome shotgun sequence n=1 Tax=Rhinocladiella mackenziei CBS 650.93 TaxID=1442369 RepID=A0A0D2I6R1_9EURO|nr:uncharacterized protein Z518_09215 [Rhinocladiella mackenziei CBS 650.93]KIX01489.1 hypothetical protein Z518_09215 [Rhinocladiella mackenziei CBS 650.93]